MIFKAINNDLNGTINKISILNRSFADLRNAISVKSNNGDIRNGTFGLLNSISPVITSRDIANIKEYNRLVGEEGVSSQTAWYRTMMGSSAAAQNLFDVEENLITTNNGLILSENAISTATNSMTLSAKASQIAFKGLSIALKAAISIGITLAIQALISKFSELAHAQEEARKKAVESANSYKEQRTSLESQIAKYRELQDSLNKGNLSADEERSIKEQLLEVQNSLVESYGNEAANLDLVNGKYETQIGLLSELSKEKANDYVTENRDQFKRAESELKMIRSYNLGAVTSWSDSVPQTDDQKKLLDFIKSYSDLLELTTSDIAGGVNSGRTTANVSIKANAEDANELLHQFSADLEQFAKYNGIDVSDFLTTGISKNARDIWTDELDEYKKIYDEYINAEIVRNDTLRPLYQQSIQAVKDYNAALSSGEGIENARTKMTELQQSVQSASNELEGSRDVFDDIFDGINKDAEAAYNLDQKFKNDDNIKSYAEMLRGLSDIDLKAINLDDYKMSNGEMPLRSLLKSLDMSKDQVQLLIDKLVELGYVYGGLPSSDSTENNLSVSDRFKDLWNSEDFKDAKSDLLDLAKESKVTAADINDLAKENVELSSLMAETGMSAQFVAKCFDTVCRGGNGFDAITSDALLLDNVLNEMSSSLQQVSNAKSDYDEAMSKDDYNADFKNYQEAYASAMEMFDKGEYGRHFFDTMEYLLGDDSYTMSIDELRAACENLKSVFGEDATNGFEFLDKLYANKDILDDMDSSLSKLSNGSYDFDLKPEEFDKIAESLGMTTEEVTACVNALGMFGDYRSYDLDKLELAMNAISIAAHNDEKSITSMQGVEKILKDLGYTTRDTYNILQDIQNMGTVQLLDFESGDTVSIISQLRELGMIKFDGSNIKLDSLVSSMQQLGASDVDITGFMERLKGQFNFTDENGNLLAFQDAIEQALTATSDNGASDDVVEVGDSADDSAKSVQSLETELDNLNGKSLSNVQLQFTNVSVASDSAKIHVQNLISKIDELNKKKINVNTAGAGTSKPSSKKGYHGTVGNAFGKGTFDEYDDLPITGYKGLPKTEKNALRSEYGQPELTVYPNGKTELTTKPTMSDLPKGTVVFNEKQTKEILDGYGDSFGKAYASGTAKKPSSSGSGGASGGTSSGTKSKDSSDKNSTKTDKKLEKFNNYLSKLFDWIEVRLDRLQRATDKWTTAAENAVTYSAQSSYYRNAVNATRKEMDFNSRAADRYEKQARKVGNKAVSTGIVSQKFVNSVMKKLASGKLNIADYSDRQKAVVEAMQSWYGNAPLSGDRWRYSI